MMARQRVIVITLLAWLPLLVLSALEGRALGGDVAVPFLLDVEVQTRYLVALPLLIGAELIVHRRMRSILEIWQVSRIELSLVPTHPDGVGGLGFLSKTVHAFTLLAVAHAAMVASLIANRIFHLGAGLLEFKVEIAVMLVFVLAVVLAPLLVFAPQLAQVKRTGLREYGTLAERYVREFDTKWLRGGAPAGEAFVGSGDLQSLADLGNSYEVVRTMKPAPVTKEMTLQLAAATLAPIVPLALTMMPLEELLKKLLGSLL